MSEGSLIGALNMLLQQQKQQDLFTAASMYAGSKLGCIWKSVCVLQALSHFIVIQSYTWMTQAWACMTQH